MNRLVIIGNGFDLAHGLPTGYCDFINDFWKNLKRDYQTDNYKQLLTINPIYYGFLNLQEITCYRDLKECLRIYSNNYGYKYRADLHKCFTAKGEIIFEFRNKFFQHICNKHNIQNWVDIENEYYQLLKNCLNEVNDNSRVITLNEEFGEVKNLLEKYLAEKVIPRFEFSKPSNEINEVKQIFNIWNRFTEKDNFIQEFSSQDKGEVERYSLLLKLYNKSGFTDIRNYINKNGMQVQNLFLNFNYTVTLDAYLKEIISDESNYYGETTLIQIHGRINDSNNKINFGFGDEMDSHYKLIEEKDDNEFLKNIKSFQYFQNTNYKRFLDFVESKEFQVYIMGHSCGLSDRILLNTVFEHPNCKSIKVFFHENEGFNNYTEIVQNISRHFNKKKMMREKIVNKSLCQPLPQNVRFEKITAHNREP